VFIPKTTALFYSVIANQQKSFWIN